MVLAPDPEGHCSGKDVDSSMTRQTRRFVTTAATPVFVLFWLAVLGVAGGCAGGSAAASSGESGRYRIELIVIGIDAERPASLDLDRLRSLAGEGSGAQRPLATWEEASAGVRELRAGGLARFALRPTFVTMVGSSAETAYSGGDASLSVRTRLRSAGQQAGIDVEIEMRSEVGARVGTWRDVRFSGPSLSYAPARLTMGLGDPGATRLTRAIGRETSPSRLEVYVIARVTPLR